MTTLLLIIIYVAFISLGLPDSLLGVTWPVMRADLGAPLEAAGLLSVTTAAGTICSSLFSGRMLARFGTGRVTCISTLLTAAALWGFHFAPSIGWLIACAVPLGLGAGAVDAGLNDYVATHYEAHHMSWLHCFWGVGATFGPILMARFMTGSDSWRSGYLTISGLQFALVVILFFSLPLWTKVKGSRRITGKAEAAAGVPGASEEENESQKPLRIRGVKLALAAFLFYSGVETTVGLWGSSFLISAKGLEAARAAQWVSLYYAGITIGRLISGFVTFRLTNRQLIRLGQLIALTGALLLFLPLPPLFSLTGLLVVGLGLAPIYPCMLHETPARFGPENSRTLMGYQMAVAYVGSTFLPPLLGFVAARSSMGFFPAYIVFFAGAMLLSSEKLNRLLQKHRTAQTAVLPSRLTEKE